METSNINYFSCIKIKIHTKTVSLKKKQQNFVSLIRVLRITSYPGSHRIVTKKILPVSKSDN